MNDITKGILKSFFDRPEVQKAVKEDNFDYVFRLWNKYSGPYDLASFLEQCGIDWIKLVTVIPNDAFWYYPGTTLDIPTNIKQIGSLPFFKSSIEEINYEGTKKEFDKIKGIMEDSFITNEGRKSIKIKCSDGEWKRRFVL